MAKYTELPIATECVQVTKAKQYKEAAVLRNNNC